MAMEGTGKKVEVWAAMKELSIGSRPELNQPLYVSCGFVMDVQ